MTRTWCCNVQPEAKYEVTQILQIQYVLMDMKYIHYSFIDFFIISEYYINHLLRSLYLLVGSNNINEQL